MVNPLLIIEGSNFYLSTRTIKMLSPENITAE
jgi:hypothetical protein